MITKVIGFSGKMYTLWEKCTTTVGYGTKHTYKPIKSISKSLDKAKALYPDAEINLELRNDRNVLWRLQKTQYPANIMPWGKYEGQKIEDVENYDYLCWMQGQIGLEEQTPIIRQILISKGYGFVTRNDGSQYLANPEVYQRYLNRTKIQEQSRKFLEEQRVSFGGFLKVNNPITIEPKRNLNLNGEIMIDEITYKFNDVRKFDYCSLPILNGKAKHIKNRKITIAEYSVDDLTVYVKSFTIEK